MNLALTLEAQRILIYFFLDYKGFCRAPYKSPGLTNLPNLANLFLKEINRLQLAGGAGCGQPPAHKAGRKTDFAGSQLATNPTILWLCIWWSSQLWM